MLLFKLLGIYDLTIETVDKTKEVEALALKINLLDLIQRTLTIYKTPSLDLIPATPITYNKNL